MTITPFLLYEDTHKYQSTQIDIPTGYQYEIQAYQRAFLARHPDVIELEDNPHLTIKYGLLDSVSKEDVQACVRKHYGKHCIDFDISWMDFFQNEKKNQDILIRRSIASPDLHNLNHILTQHLPNVITHPKYNPHVTLAYMKYGTAKAFIETFGRLCIDIPCISVNHFTFSSCEEKYETIWLK